MAKGGKIYASTFPTVILSPFRVTKPSQQGISPLFDALEGAF